MKRFAFIFAAFAACFAVSCNKEMPESVTTPTVQDGFKTVTITADIADADTKTSYDADGKFSWTKGDQISVLASDNNFYTFTATETAATSTFTGVLPVDVELGTYALYPASEVHYYDSENWQPYFGIDKYKDLTGTFSADLPMTAKIGENNAYTFKHATSALLFTFTNIPSKVVAVEISFENESLQFSGRHKAYYAEPWSLNFLETGNTDDDRKFVRKVSVENNTAKVYLPFKGTLWGGYDNIINIVGFDAQGNELVLLENKLMPGNDLAVKTLGQVIPVKPLALNNLSVVDWESENVATSVIDHTAQYSQVKELKVCVDDYYMYVRLNASFTATYAGDYLDVFLSDGEGESNVWWGWATKGTDNYTVGLSSHKGAINKTTGELESMEFVLPDQTEVDIDIQTKLSGEDVYWYLAYPLTYIEPYISTENKVYVSFMLWNSWNPYGVIPTINTNMLEVTLP